MDQNPEIGGRSDQSRTLAVCELELQTEVQSFMSSQPPKFTSKFEGYRDSYIYIYVYIHAKKLYISSLFSLQVIPIHCLREFC